MKIERVIYYGITAMFAVFMLAVAVTAQAQEPVEMYEGISLQPPTHYTDGSQIGPDGLERMNLWCGETGYTQDMVLAPDQTLVSKDEVMAHFAIKLNTAYYCAATATASNGRISEYSVQVSFIVPDDRVPRRPGIGVR